MWHANAAKGAVLLTLAAIGYASTWVSFDTTALDSHVSNVKTDRRLVDFGSPGRTALTDTELAETHARPLFSQNRRPFVPKPVVVEQAIAQVEQSVVEQPISLPRRLALIGTNISGPGVSALVRNTESEEVRWLKIGDAFDGWILSSTSADRAAFVCREKEGDDCEYRLELYPDPGGQ